MRRLFVIGTLLGAGALMSACDSHGYRLMEREQAAKEFKGTLFCPTERILTTRHPELQLEPSEQYMARIQNVERPKWEEPTPPPEIVKDPARYRLWYENRTRAFDHWHDQDSRLDPTNDYLVKSLKLKDVVIATGCGETRLYGCEARYASCIELGHVAAGDPVRLVCRDESPPSTEAAGTVSCDPAALPSSQSQAAR